MNKSDEMVTDEMLDRALAVLNDPELRGAKSRAAAEFQSDYLKIVKARLELKAVNAKTQAEKERWALAHQDYEEQLEVLKSLKEEDYKHRQKQKAAEATIEAWRTIKADKRVSHSVR